MKINVSDLDNIIETKEEFSKKSFYNDRVSIYTYHVCMQDTFINPLEKELRGLTVVDNNKIFLSMSKFFNVNEREETQYNIIKDKKIDYVALKQDGSLVSFIELDNEIIPKTKGSFNSEQLKLVKKCLNDNIINFVKDCFKNGLHPLFEIVSPKNKIVIRYPETKLILIAIRDSNGNYLNIKNIDIPKEIEITELLDVDTLDNVKKELIKRNGEIEGFVIKFEDGQIVKFKTDKYVELHGLYDDITRDNLVFDICITDSIDDVISKIDDEYAKSVLLEKHKIYCKEFNRMKNEAENLYNKYTGDIKEFAIKYNKDPYFKVVMKVIRGNENSICNALKNMLKFYITKLKTAKVFFEGKYDLKDPRCKREI